jgi:hypothetical protein
MHYICKGMINKKLYTDTLISDAMKKFFLFIILVASGQCYAATGNASDGELALIAIITLLFLPVAAIYFIHFLKNSIHDFRDKRMFRKHLAEHNGDS